MPTATRKAGRIIYSDHGVRFASWAFTDRAKRSGLMPSMGSIGDCYDKRHDRILLGQNANRTTQPQRWNTWIEVANAIFDYREIFHNRNVSTPAWGCALR